MGRVSVKGVLIGGIVDIAASLTLDLLIAVYVICRPGASGTSTPQAAAVLVSASPSLHHRKLRHLCGGGRSFLAI